jgi:hypothetical protein
MQASRSLQRAGTLPDIRAVEESERIRSEMFAHICRKSAVCKKMMAWQPSQFMFAPGPGTAVDTEHVLLILLIEAPTLLS